MSYRNTDEFKRLMNVQCHVIWCGRGNREYHKTYKGERTDGRTVENAKKYARNKYRDTSADWVVVVSNNYPFSTGWTIHLSPGLSPNSAKYRFAVDRAIAYANRNRLK